MLTQFFPQIHTLLLLLKKNRLLYSLKAIFLFSYTRSNASFPFYLFFCDEIISTNIYSGKHKHFYFFRRCDSCYEVHTQSIRRLLRLKHHHSDRFTRIALLHSPRTSKDGSHHRSANPGTLACSFS